ncbi:MAG: hypothetical protein IJ784_03595, partial [Ruminiclostridium sp.]|nr:hypothetical protein [Ruminiclostridium sp.]
QKYDDRIVELQREIEAKINLLNAFKEISDTYNDISQGDYISKLMKSEQKLEVERRASTQERSASKHDAPAPKPPMHGTAPKPEQQESVPEKSEPKPDEHAQKLTVHHKSRSRERG